MSINLFSGGSSCLYFVKNVTCVKSNKEVCLCASGPGSMRSSWKSLWQEAFVMELAPSCQNYLQSCQLECRLCQASEEQLFYLSPCCLPPEPEAEDRLGRNTGSAKFKGVFILFCFSLVLNIFLLISETPQSVPSQRE